MTNKGAIKIWKRKKNNTGFTLVELLIGITILGIVVIPFLHAFITSAKTNDKSQRIMRATAVCENIMEEVANLDYTDIADGLSGADTDKTIISAKAADGYKELTDLASADGQSRSFAIWGIEQDGTKYDVKINIDASSYYRDADGDEAEYNDQTLVNLSDLSLDSDILFSLDTSMGNKVGTEFVDRNTAYRGQVSDYTSDDFLSILTRTVTVDITQAGTEVNVKVSVKYECPSGYVATADRTYEKTLGVTKKNIATETLGDIYILFYPNYSSIAGNIKDKFVINNTSKVPANIYLVKQVQGQASEILSRELYYVPEVDLNEMTYWGDEKAAPVTAINSNFSYNLGKKEMGLADYSMQDKAKYIYNGLTETETKTKTLLSPKGLLNEESETRIFHTTVEVYKTGSFKSSTNTFDTDGYLLKMDN